LFLITKWRFGAVRFSEQYFRPHENLRLNGPMMNPRVSRRNKRWLAALLRVVFVAGVLLGIAMLCQAGWNVLHSHHAFALRSLQVLGVERHNPGAVRDALSGLMGENLLALDTDAVTAKLQAVSWVEGFVYRKHLPDTLIVEVRERTAICAVATANGNVAIDGAGNVWPAEPSLPVAAALAPGAVPTDGGVQSVVAELMKVGLAGQIASVGRGAGGAYVLTTQDGWTLETEAGSVAEAWRKYVAARPWVAAYKPGWKTMDLRWAGRVALVPPALSDEGEHNG
jgi:cell division protein FtsQ